MRCLLHFDTESFAQVRVANKVVDVLRVFVFVEGFCCVYFVSGLVGWAGYGGCVLIHFLPLIVEPLHKETSRLRPADADSFAAFSHCALDAVEERVLQEFVRGSIVWLRSVIL